MNITINMLLAKLDNHEYKHIEGPDEGGRFIRDVVLFDVDDCDFNSEVLYVVLYSHLLERPESSLPLNILCLLDIRETPKVMYPPDSSIILVKHNVGTDQIIQQMKQIILSYNKWSDTLVQTLTNDQGIQRIIEVGSEFLKNPLRLLGSNLDILASSTIFEVNNPRWFASGAKGYVESPHSNEIKQFLDKLSQTSAPFRFTAVDLSAPVVCVSVMVVNKRVGMLIVIEENQPITPGDIDAALFLGSIIALEMQKSELIRRNRGVFKEQILIDILEDSIRSKEDLEYRVKNADWNFKNIFFILLIRANEYYLTGHQLFKFKEQLKNKITNSRAIIYHESILIVINQNSADPLSKNDAAWISEFLTINGMCGGLSQPSSDFFDLKKLYNQAIRALEIGPRINAQAPVYYYWDYNLFDMIDTCASHADISNFYHAPMSKLIEYDKNNHTSFADTLKVYVNKKNNQLATAKAMKIHRSTLLYRIDKIQRIMDVDLNDAITALHIQLSFLMMDYIIGSISSKK